MWIRFLDLVYHLKMRRDSRHGCPRPSRILKIRSVPLPFTLKTKNPINRKIPKIIFQLEPAGDPQVSWIATTRFAVFRDFSISLMTRDPAVHTPVHHSRGPPGIACFVILPLAEIHFRPTVCGLV